MSSSSWSAAFVNVYMPSDDRSIDTMVDYVHILGELQASLEDVSTENIVCLRDFNADPTRGRLWDPLMTFCTDAGLVVAAAVLPPGAFTFLGASHNTTSWLDHLLRTGDVHISNIDVLYDVSIFDHFPLVFDLRVNFVNYSLNNNQSKLHNRNFQFVDWPNVDNVVYNNKAESMLCNIDICDKLGCLVDHREQISLNYKLIVNALITACDEYIVRRERKFIPVTGWNRFCRNK